MYYDQSGAVVEVVVEEIAQAVSGHLGSAGNGGEPYSHVPAGGTQDPAAPGEEAGTGTGIEPDGDRNRHDVDYILGLGRNQEDPIPGGDAGAAESGQEPAAPVAEGTDGNETEQDAGQDGTQEADVEHGEVGTADGPKPVFYD